MRGVSGRQSGAQFGGRWVCGAFGGSGSQAAVISRGEGPDGGGDAGARGHGERGGASAWIEGQPLVLVADAGAAGQAGCAGSSGAEFSAPVVAAQSEDIPVATFSIDLIIGPVLVRLDGATPAARVAQLALAVRAFS